MTARPPRASTRGEPKGKRARTRGATAAERADKPAARRSPSAVSTDPYERIDDDDVLEVAEVSAPPELREPPELRDLPELPDLPDLSEAPEVLEAPAPPELGDPPRLRLMVLETAPHLASAQGAIVAAGHAVAFGAGREAIDKLRFAVGEVDALLVGMPGGEVLLDAALALGPQRPVVIAAWTAGAVEAARRSAAVGADLATVRPHHVERLAPLLLAAGRLVEHRRAPWAPAGAAGAPDAALAERDLEPDPEPAGLLSAEAFAQAAARELDRARRYGYPLAVAMFAVDVAPPPPPPGLRGILRARAGNALVHALRDIDLATELDQERFLVAMPHTDRALGAEVARRIIGAVAAGDPVVAAGRAFPPRVIGAVAGSPPGEALDLPRLVRDATQLLEQAQMTGAQLAVES